LTTKDNISNSIQDKSQYNCLLSDLLHFKFWFGLYFGKDQFQLQMQMDSVLLSWSLIYAL